MSSFSRVKHFKIPIVELFVKYFEQHGLRAVSLVVSDRKKPDSKKNTFNLAFRNVFMSNFKGDIYLFSVA